jgi:hypothetical protein
MPKLYIGDSNNNPIRLKKMYIGDGNNNPIKLKKIWIGDSSNNPLLIFTEGATEGYMYDFDASTGQYNQTRVSSIINAVNGAPSKIQPWHLITDKTDTWGLGSWDGRPISFNNQNGRCGRGGTFRFPNPVDNATLVCVQRLNFDLLSNEMFTNSCYFNEKGEYRYETDRFYYTGRTIATLTYRDGAYVPPQMIDFDSRPQVNTSGGTEAVPFINQNTCCVWMYTNGNNVHYRIKSYKNDLWTKVGTRESISQIQDVRVCDHAGGGVEALTGELYEFIIWPRILTAEEIAETEEYLLDKWV